MAKSRGQICRGAKSKGRGLSMKMASEKAAGGEKGRDGQKGKEGLGKYGKRGRAGGAGDKRRRGRGGGGRVMVRWV